MLPDVVLHDSVVPMGVNPNVCVMREAEVHDIAKDAVDIRVAGNTMDYMIRLCVIQPLAIVYL